MIALLTTWAAAQTLDNPDLEASTAPVEVPNLTEHAVDQWTFSGDGVAPFVQAQVATVGIPVYCAEPLMEDSPSNIASGGVLRHFAHVEGLDAAPVGGVTNEWVETVVRDLVPGQPYKVTFEASIVRHLGQTPGHFRVWLGDQSLDAEVLVLPAANPGQQAWVEQAVEPFVAESVDVALRFEAISLPALAPGTVTAPNDCDAMTVPGLAQLLLDGVNVVPDEDQDGLFDDVDPCLDLGDPAMPDDQDQDGLSQELEVVWGTDPCVPDSDGDGLLDGEEVARLEKTKATSGGVQCPHPMVVDTDGDDLSDGDEVAGWTVSITCDTDTTASTDGFLVGSDPCDPNSDEDAWGDARERAEGTNPLEHDTDGDVFWDHHDADPLSCDAGYDTADTGTLSYTDEEIAACCNETTKACCDRSAELDWPDTAGCSCSTGRHRPWLGLGLGLGLLLIARRPRRRLPR